MLLNYSKKFVEIFKCYSSIPKKFVEICKCYSIIPKNSTTTISVRFFFGIFETQNQNSLSSPKILKITLLISHSTRNSVRIP